jgi:uncharacterized protein YmfQ (DUF2313 family)
VSRDIAAHHAELLGELPPGEALPRDATSNVGKLLRPIADELAGFAAWRERLLAQISPVSAVELLPDYERILGPDPCRRDLLLTDIGQRQRYAELRWNGPGQALGPQALVAVAAAMGVPLTVETFDPDVCGGGECGDDLTAEIGPETEVYTWLAHAPVYALSEGECGGSECGERINDYEAADLDCPLGQYVPPHIFLRIAYDLEV